MGGSGGCFLMIFGVPGCFSGYGGCFLGYGRCFLGYGGCFRVTVDIFGYVGYFELRWIFWISDVGYIGFWRLSGFSNFRNARIWFS